MTMSNKPTVKFNIALINHPISSVKGSAVLSNFIEVLEPLANKIYVITARFSYASNKKINVINIRIKDDRKESNVIKSLKYLPGQLLLQLKLSFHLFKIFRDIHVVIFFIGTRIYVLPVLSAKLLRKKTILIATGSQSKSFEAEYGETIFSFWGVIPFFFRVLERINFSLADQIAVESKSVVDFMDLSRYKKKIAINGAMYVDTDSFKIKRELKDRGNLVGYTGQLSRGKGVMNFVKAIPLILKNRDDVEFLIAGDGALSDKIKNEIESGNFTHKVKLKGFVPHDELSDYLNRLKLLILPSYTEGLPGIIQEAMACGVVVLATPVGGIPDLIKDGETGFILKDNSPECIAKNVIKILEHQNLDRVIKNARKLIEDEYAYEVMVKKCKDSLDNLMKKCDKYANARSKDI